MSISSAPGRHGVAHVGELRLEQRAARRERRRDARHVHAAAAQRVHRDLDEVRVDADGGDRGAAGSLGSGRIALAQSERTLPCVSAPSRVVRSTMRIAVSSAQALLVVLMLRVASPAARASAPTWSTPGRPCRKRRSDASSRVTSRSVIASPKWLLRVAITDPQSIPLRLKR